MNHGLSQRSLDTLHRIFRKHKSLKDHDSYYVYNANLVL
jgi:hypothetical protein